MVELELDGRKVEVEEGSMVMHAADKAGTYIPHFCYHKKLTIAANCRMCLVDIEKMPKPMPACATPASKGMIVRTRSDKAVRAQQSVMEFLLINHPLDCPVCDQGGECQLQDLAVGYGGSASRYQEHKRVVFHKNVGPLLCMEEMARCIHCTRCIRFGQEIGGVMELGMIHRGEHSEITTVLGDTVDSELSGNMIDLCPVGAITSKPFRFQARNWELSRRKSISPHDSTGANLIVQVKNNQVMRVLPLENEAVNECWLADRDRFSYEALNSEERLTKPMLKQGGEWLEVDWQTALEYVANGLRQTIDAHGPQAVGALVSPHSTLEELHLAASLMRALGSENIDHRLRNADFTPSEGVRHLGRSIASLSELQAALVIGSNLRKDHPLFAQRIRQSAKKGCVVSSIDAAKPDWAMPVANALVAPAADWARALADLAASVAAENDVEAPLPGTATESTTKVAKALLAGKETAILLGNAAMHHPNAYGLLALAQWIGRQTGASVGVLSEAANTVGAQLVAAEPGSGGRNAAQMLQGACHALLLLNTEPEFDSAAGAPAARALADCDMVVTLSPFKANMAFSDVLLPIAPFTETPGTFVNSEARIQSFFAVVKPLGDTRPAWKVMRVLADLLGLQGFDFDSSQQVLEHVVGTGKPTFVASDRLSNASRGQVDLSLHDIAPPASAGIYQLDGLVRRAPSLQLTVDARHGSIQAAQSEAVPA